MDTQILNTNLVEVALDRVTGTEFEKFSNEFLPGLIGIDFIPLGGQKDGGADAFHDDGLLSGNKPGIFYQASIQQDYRTKIRSTVKRLRDFGREPKQLTYITSRIVPHIDLEESNLTEELGIVVRIRDRRYIASHINQNRQTVAAFNNHLLPVVRFLDIPGNVPLISKTMYVVSPSVYVFLRQEVERRSGKASLLESVTDSLILWALEGTDPDKEIFLTQGEILSKIIDTVPPAKHFIKGILRKRLEVLSDKSNPSGREIRWHRREDKYCLPYETRLLVERENLEDETLRLRVLERFKERVAQLEILDSDVKTYDIVSGISLRAVQLTFEKEGLEFSHFLSNRKQHDTYESIADNIDQALSEISTSGSDVAIYKEAAYQVLRGSFYSSSIEERLYFSKLSRTYSLLFSLNSEPRIVEYFQSMASDFYLYVGSDILVRALSERYLRSEDQITRNMLKMVAVSGATLVLAEPVLDEISSHLEGTDWEFQNYCARTENHIDINIARHSPKILIRAYFYAKLDPETHSARPKSWADFVNQFCDFDKLHKSEGKTQLREYLLSEFQMQYEGTDELDKLCTKADVDELADKIRESKKERILAVNDATLVLSIYGRRKKLKELSKVTGFGYRTWWLTGETKILKYTAELVRKHGGSLYMMRPEFLLNFIALSPTTAEVRKAFANIFPTLLGIRLSGRIREDIFHQLMEKMNDAKAVDDGRLQAMAEEYSNRLKGDLYKKYEIEFNH